jgi:hypothetical protein
VEVDETDDKLEFPDVADETEAEEFEFEIFVESVEVGTVM